MKVGKLGLSIIFAVFGIGFALPFVVPYFTGSADAFKLYVGVGMASAMALVGFVVIWMMGKNTERAKELLAEPRKIAWVYGVEQSVNGVTTAKPVQLLAFDGTSARLAAGNQIEVLMQLQRELPHAIFGYGPAQAAEFDRRAQMLSA